MMEEALEFLDADTLADQIDALIDLRYFVLGTFVETGTKIRHHFRYEISIAQLYVQSVGCDTI